MNLNRSTVQIFPSRVQETLRQALTELAAASEREYLNDGADREQAERYYADVDADSDPVAFFTALATLLEKTHCARPSYRPAVELYPWVDLQPNGKLRSMYTQEEYDPRALIEDAAEIEQRRAAFRASRRAEGASADSVEAQVEKVDPYNCEHVVPQSWFAHDEPMRGDLHHLFTCESKCNSFRGNTPYADHPDQLEKIRERCGNTEAAGFEPWAGKGPAARATLYFLIRYPELLHSHYPEVGVAMLVDWHQAEPVSEYERHRNAAIFERQGNRNPVIDHPEWAAKVALDQRLKSAATTRQGFPGGPPLR